MNWKLQANERFKGAKGPVVLVVLDGVGEGLHDKSDAVFLAKTPLLDSLKTPGHYRLLAAHGTSVGLPSDDDMGNSEVGHNALGCGQIHDQGALLIERAFASRAIFKGDAWQKAMAATGKGGALHFIALLSDGNVHSNIKHLIAMLEEAGRSGAKRLYVHALLDGRDVPPTSAMVYVEQLEKVLAALQASGVDAKVASGGGRMTTTMDRYGADWAMVERGYRAHVQGRSDHRFPSLRAAVEGLRAESPGIGDQNLPTFVIEDASGKSVGPMQDGDAVILANFRGDRAIEISQALGSEEFSEFDREEYPDIFYAGLMQYDGDLHIPGHYLVEPPTFDETMGEYLARNHVTQLAIAETQKFGHVTYFWNGNRSGKFDKATETYIEIASDNTPFNEHPAMKAVEITDALIAQLRDRKPRFARVNYANGDMVGHTGDLAATIAAVQVLDQQLARLKRVVDELDGILLITADHGNADEMYQHDKAGHILSESGSDLPMVKTSHTLNAVPFMIYDPQSRGQYELDPGIKEAGIANVAATCIELLGFVPPADMQASLLHFS